MVNVSPCNFFPQNAQKNLKYQNGQNLKNEQNFKQQNPQNVIIHLAALTDAAGTADKPDRAPDLFHVEDRCRPKGLSSQFRKWFCGYAEHCSVLPAGNTPSSMYQDRNGIPV